jgi:hypothetical protein
MNITIENVYAADDIGIGLEFRSKKLIFNVKPLYKKVDKSTLEGDRQFALLNKFFNRMGYTDTMLFGRYEKLYELIIRDTITTPSNEFIKELYSFLDLFDYPALIDFVKDESRRVLLVPEMIPGDFDNTLAQDDIHTKAQTYVRSEYEELIAITLVCKAVFPILGTLSKYNTNVVVNKLETMCVFDIVSKHPIFKTRPIERLRAFIHSHTFESNKKFTIDALQTIAIHRGIGLDDLSDYILTNILFKTLPWLIVEENVTNKNLASSCYKAIANVVDKDIASLQRIKPQTTDDESKESVIEKYRYVSDLSTGNLAEYNTYASSPEDVLQHFCMHHGIPLSAGDLKELRSVVKSLKPFRNYPIIDGTVSLVGMFISPVIDARALKFLDRDMAINMIGVVFKFLTMIGFTELAHILTLTKLDDSHVISDGGGMTPLGIDIKEILDSIYPVQEIVSKTVNKNELLNPGVELIVRIVKSYTTGTLHYLIKPEDVGQVFSRPTHFRNLIGEAVILSQMGLNNNYMYIYRDETGE